MLLSFARAPRRAIKWACWRMHALPAATLGALQRHDAAWAARTRLPARSREAGNLAGVCLSLLFRHRRPAFLGGLTGAPAQSGVAERLLDGLRGGLPSGLFCGLFCR